MNIEKITKKRFIELLFNNRSIHIGSFNNISDDKKVKMFNSCKKFMDTEIVKDKDYRTVIRGQTNALEFSNGSWVYFKDFKECYQYKNVLVGIYYSDMGRCKKALVYYLDDLKPYKTEFDNMPVDKRVNRVKKFLNNKFSNAKGRESLKYSSTAVVTDINNVPITYQVFTDSWIAFYLKTPLNLPVVPDGSDYPDLSRMINFNNYEMSVPFNLSIKECLNIAKLKGDDVYIPLYDDRWVDSRKIKTVTSILDTKDLTIYKPKYDNKRPLLLVANNGDFAIVSVCKKAMQNGK